jgi:predicted O-methyltransferase YrrM
MQTANLIAKAFTFGMIQVPEEITQLVELVKKLRPKNVLEIGSESGGTFYLWCQLAPIGGLKISVDLPSGASGSGRFTEKEALAKRASQFKGWSANVRVVTGDSHEQRTRCEVADILSGEKVDFLFIDGDHSKEGVMLDWEDYKTFVRPGGIVAFHDIKDTEYHRRRSCFVADFWKELKGEKQEILAGAEHWGGIGVVTV